MRKLMLGVVALALTVTACANDNPSVGGGPSSQSVAPTPVSASSCAQQSSSSLTTAGQLTIGTDNPAFPPYFEGREGGNTEPWDPEWGDPTSGDGFESAVAFAVAEQLGYSRDAVTWIPVAFNNSYAPGEKDFDFFIGQVTFNEARAENADLSEGYYFGNQTVVVMADSEFATATTITELKDAELGAQVGTTSLATIEEVIQPTVDPAVFNTTDDAIESMTNPDGIDGIVVDLPTAAFITGVQVEGATIVGQIGAAAGAQPEHFSLVLELDSPVTACINAAIAALTDDGTLDALSDEWLPFSSVPELQP